VFSSGRGLVAQVSGDGAQVLPGRHEPIGPHVPDGMVPERPQSGLAADAPEQAAALIEGLAGSGMWVARAEVHLTPIEFKLLGVLVSHSGKKVPQWKLLQEV
jgi:hypothetical protein